MTTLPTIEDEFRRCIFCARPIRKCDGFTLARDVLALLNGERIIPREMCGPCGLAMLLRFDP